MSALPRNVPKKFYDLVVQVAIIRPGPIVGKMMNPYMKRRQGREPVRYAHPSLEPILKRTLGVPLFQEQLLRIAMTAANFTGGEAEDLRRAMGHKRSRERMLEIENKLRRGMEQNGIGLEAQEEIITSISSFALYGFPESHAASFALIAYASAYLKCHYLAAFTAALLNNQPMGFYSAATIVKDAQRHGLKVKPVDVLRSEWLCTLEQNPPYKRGTEGSATAIAEPSGGCLDEYGKAGWTTPWRFAPPPLLRGNTSFNAASCSSSEDGVKGERESHGFGGRNRQCLDPLPPSRPSLCAWFAKRLRRCLGARTHGRAICIHRRPDPASSGTQQKRVDDACTSWGLEWIG